jgi:polyketide cyclase/dehydrase/lipid transport protein
MPSSDPSATVTVKVAADPTAVYALITDLEAMAQLAEETAAMRWAQGSAAAVGAVFKGTNRNGWRRWTTTCTVTDAEPGHRFAFEVRHTVVPIARWEYVIEATDEGCAVTESTWDRRPAWFKAPAGLFTGVPKRAEANTAHIEATLRRLKARAETESAAA